MFSFNGDANNDPGAGRIGLSYRSKIKYNVIGSVNFTNPTPPTLGGALAPLNPVVGVVSSTINQTRLNNGGVTLDIKMPDLASLSYYQRSTTSSTSGDAMTGWSTIPELRILRRLAACFRCSRTSRHVALFGGGQLPTTKTTCCAWALPTIVAGQQRRPRAASARQRPHVASGCRKATPRSTGMRRRLHLHQGSPIISVAGVLGQPPSIAATGLINGEYNSHVMWCLAK
jgi:hypothetical protein